MLEALNFSFYPEHKRLILHEMILQIYVSEIKYVCSLKTVICMELLFSVLYYLSREHVLQGVVLFMHCLYSSC